jgi:hypothetical protein
MNKRISTVFAITVIIIIAGIIAFLSVMEMDSIGQTGNNSSQIKLTRKACTQEAKLCPDGSYVSRTGPNCEFAACSSENNLVGNDKDEHGCIGSAGYIWCEEKQKCLRTWEEICGTLDLANWKTYQNENYGFEFKYPAELVPASETSQGLPFLYVRKNDGNSSFSNNLQFGTPYTFASKGTIEENLDWTLKEYNCYKDGTISLINAKACCYDIRRPNAQTGIGDLGPEAKIVGKDKVIFIYYNISKNTEIAQAEKVLKQILSTFKFTK